MDLVEHYRRLLSVAQWLDMGLNWTVVQRPDRPVGRAWMLYAADGHIRLWMHNLDPHEVHGPDPHALDHLVHLLPDPFTIASRASALALVTMDSGAHLDPEWFELPQREIHPLV
ncbi:hypothetical protein FLW53_28745 [Microbispora sp. SCL1-1]|uniref:hypothetical protein n=1 Tax=unclassified Microbispora TaxID=2614687 RepID=UPI0011596803|nr:MULTISPECIES: hypothetical protein [unclassified Microbispora]NJP28115.1 hypothetical protein [Microbispora sp. CL1-1]TQS09471.1 hypothetical protein FLW53_28745 [Microbispora sp. SCL1-1]